MKEGEALRLIDPDAPARGLLRAGWTGGDGGFFDTDDRLALGVAEPVTERVAEPEVTRKARVSWLAVIGLCLGLIGVLAALTATLTPIAVAAGFAGLFFSVAGYAATHKPYLASRPLAGLAVLFSLAALVLTAMVYSGQFEWLNRDDQVGWLRNWLDVRVPGLDRW